ncbi:MAG: MYG1 family protein [Ruminococcus flavefaciens]|nr:MYG1 family protein [Ruminococcus flavefaciens]MCM1361307.1 MYG1 family protein [Clostridiales bacterium]
MNLLTNAYTHSGKFHADDVFSSALLRILYPEIKFHRVHQLPDEAYDSDRVLSLMLDMANSIIIRLEVPFVRMVLRMLLLGCGGENLQ